MQTAEFICVWFADQRHVMLVDRRSMPSATLSSAAGSPGWRAVASSTAAAEPAERAGETKVSVWPPLYPDDLPMLIGPEDALKRIEIFDLSPSSGTQMNPDVPVQFELDPSLTVSRADSWYVLPCCDPGDPLQSAPFGEAACIGRHVFAADPVPALLDEIIAQAGATRPKAAPAIGYLIVPVIGQRVGPALLAQYRPYEPDVTVDLVLQPRPDGTLQPVVEMKASTGTDLKDAIGSFRYCVFRRNAGRFGLPDFAYSHPPLGSDAHQGDRVLFSLPEPILHGDVIGIVSRGVTFTLAPRLGPHIERSIETRDLRQVALLVRQEDGFITATDDTLLQSSGRLDDLRETIAAATSDIAMDRLLWSLKVRLARHLMRTAVATSYLIDRAVAMRARAELTDLLLGERVVHLEHIAFAAASASRLERLVAAQRPLDEPLHSLARGFDKSMLAACLADIAELGDLAGHGSDLSLLQAVLSDGLAAQAIVNVATRASAVAHLEAAMAG